MKNGQLLHKIFSDALAIESPAERDAFLDKACGGDAALRAEVNELLALMPAVSEDFLGGSVTAPPPLEGVGTLIGPYTLRKLIGEGGMGAVFLAEQCEPVRRKVALKIVRAEVNSRQVLARFDAERQALALMDHPNIAKIFDAGTTATKNPYFVMELVDGAPITEFCDAQRLPVRDRLALFALVCRAIQHAHEKGVIHRDIKPSNVLVAVHDGLPVPKVIDFGVAKAIDQKLSSQTLTTQLGSLIGTLEYMSPEQADLSALGVDARSDIYSLGVLLYELLTGATPLDAAKAREAAVLETLKVIREVDPAKPSTRIAEAKLNLQPLAMRRGTEPGSLVKLVRGELDWIAMKALDKDRLRRYESAAGLGRDVERYLRDEPVEASPPGKWYRFSKFVRRNKIVVSAAAAVALAVIGGLIVSTVMYFKERDARGRAETAEANESGLRVKAQAAEREATLRLRDARVAQGDMYGTSGQWIKARETYLQGQKEFRSLVSANDPLQFPIQAGLLESLIHAPEPLMIYGGYTSVLNTVALRSDLNLLATGDSDGAVRLWNLQTGNEIRSFQHNKAVVTSVVFSRDGRRLLSGGLDRNAILWEVESGKQLHVYNRHKAAINGVAFSKDEKAILIGCGDGTARLLDVETGDEIFKLPHDGWVSSVAFSPNGRALVTGSMDGKVRLWDATNGKLLREMEGNKEKVLSVKFSPDGSRIYSAGGTGDAFAADAITGKVVTEFQGHSGNVTGIAVSPRGNMVLTSSMDNVTRAWLINGRSMNDYAIAQRASPFLGVGYSTDGTMYATAGGDGTAQLWDVKAVALAGPFSGYVGPEEKIARLAVSRDGRIVVAASLDGTLSAWDTATLAELRRFEGLIQAHCVALSQDNRILVGGGNYGMIRAWDFYSGKELDIFLGHTKDVTAVAFVPNSHKFMSGASDGTLKLWDLDSKKPAKDTAVQIYEGHTGDPSADRVDEIQFNGDGSRAYTTSSYQMKIWDLSAVAPLNAWRIDQGGQFARLLDNARGVLTGSRANNSMELRDVATGEVRRTFLGHTGRISGAVILPGNRWVVTGGVDKKVKVFDMSTAAEVRTFECIHPVTALAGSPDGRYIFAGTEYGKIQRWDLTAVATFLDLQRALPQAQDALKKNPDDAQGLRILGEWYAFRGVPEWAIDYFEKYRKVAGAHATVSSLTLGRCYGQVGRFEDALREFQAEAKLPQISGSSAAEETDRQRYLALMIDFIQRKMNPPKAREDK